MRLSLSKLVTLIKKLRISLLVSSISGIAVFYFLYYSETATLPDLTNTYLWLFYFVINANIIGLALIFTNKLLDKRISWINNLSVRLTSGLLLNIFTTYSAVFVVGFFCNELGLFENNLMSSIKINTDFISKLSIILLISVVIFTIFNFAFYSYFHYTFSQVESAKAQRNYLELQFETLKSQLSPHYLFNCLNTISSLVFKDANMAEDFIRRLANTYQYILKNNNKKYVSLQEEIDFVKSYNYLLQVRFQSNLKLDINIPSSIMDSKIPPITLQMLVENAVKHNVITESEPLHIYIGTTDNTHLNVINTKTTTPSNVNSFHVGLQNIEKRYEYLTKDKIRISNNHKYSVALPVVKNADKQVQ
ncbi:MAG: histidine kinase [Fulvivirga sp.]|uniref:sensor histidine kinase n=1 Tax=Fulvivirga sp. TaxID=1931237 RepID=UPI0032ED3791